MSAVARWRQYAMWHDSTKKPLIIIANNWIAFASCSSSFSLPLSRKMVTTSLHRLLIVALMALLAGAATPNNNKFEAAELPEPSAESDIYYISVLEDQEARTSRNNVSAFDARLKNKKRKNSLLSAAVEAASLQGLNAMIDLYERKEPEILRKGQTIQLHRSRANSDKTKKSPFQVNISTSTIRLRN